MSSSPRRGHSRSPRRTRIVPLASSTSSQGKKRLVDLLVPSIVVFASLFILVLILRSPGLLIAARYVPHLIPVFLKIGADPSAVNHHGHSVLHALCYSRPTVEHYELLARRGLISHLATDLFALQAVHYCSVSSPQIAHRFLIDGARRAPGAPSLIHPLLEALEEVFSYMKAALPLSHRDTSNHPLGSGTSPLAATFLIRARITALDAAAHTLDLAKLLLDHGATPNTLDPYGRPLLHICLQYCNGLLNEDSYDDAEARREFLDLLLDSPALNVSECDAEMRNSLFFACNSSLVARLVEDGADVNAVSLLGETPLEYQLRLLHDAPSPAQQAGVVAALASRNARLGGSPFLLGGLLLHDSALGTTVLSDHLPQIVDFAIRELRLPFFRLLDTSDADVELCTGPRDVFFYSKAQVPPIRSVLDQVLHIVAVNGTFSVSQLDIPMANAKPVTLYQLPLRELTNAIYIRNAERGCLVLHASLRAS